MPEEVCYERMRPEQIRAAREACPVLYIPIGTIEWHGFHNPVGLDTLKIHGICVRCAQAGGGLVFPPLWYGESREEALMDSNPGTCAAISEAMGLDPANFEPGYMRTSPSEQIASYQNLLLHVLNQAQSLGFRVLVMAAGHYPLIDHARAAASTFHQQRRAGSRYDKQAVTWVFTGYELVRDVIPDAGDHAGFWETSLMLALDPEPVDLSVLPDDPKQRLLAVGSRRPVQESNAEFGEEAIRLIVERVTKEARARLDNPEAYQRHGLRL